MSTVEPQGEPEKPSPQVLTVAEEAVKELGIAPFVDKYLDDISRRILDSENEAEDVPINADMLFVANALPIINGVIHIASDRATLRKAMEWARKKFQKKGEGIEEPDFNPVTILSALTLIDVVNRAWEKSRKLSESEQKQWDRIMERMARFSEEATGYKKPA